MAEETSSEDVYSNLHRALKVVLDIVPRTASQLVPTLNKHYPYKSKGQDLQVCVVFYTDNPPIFFLALFESVLS